MRPGMKHPPLVSLLTDFGLQDNFVGLMKAVILRINPACRIVDICHEVGPQDIRRAALLLENSFGYFPEGTIHLAVVDPGVGSRRRKLLVETRRYYFIGPDNGVLSLALKKERPLRVIELSNSRFFLKPVSDTFQGRDVFASIAGHLSAGIPAGRFGRRVTGLQQLALPIARRKGGVISGEVVYIDRFGNLATNIGKALLEGFNRKQACVCVKDRLIRGISRSYQAAPKGRLVALISSFNTLEIAVADGSASACLGAGPGTKITIRRG